MKTKIILIILLVTVLLSACNKKTTSFVVIRYTEDDTTTHVKFLATIITGDSTRVFVTETPYKIEFIDQSYIVTAYPEADSVNLYMESWDNSVRSSRAKGWAHSGTMFCLKPNGGPGYFGNPK